MEEHHDIEVNYIEGDDVTQDVTQGESQGGIQDIPYPTSTTTSLPLTIAFLTRS